MQVTNYKCPSCGSLLTFRSETQKMGCDSCNSVFSIQELDGKKEQKEEKSYECPSCGANIIADKTTSATRCPYCNNTTIFEKQFEGKFEPEYIIPFKINREEAVKTLKEYYKGKRLLPKGFASDNTIEEIKGVYIPFWIFDCDADVDMTYNGEKITTWSDSRYRYTRREDYRLVREGGVFFKNIPVDASSKIDNTLMEAIEPFDYNELVDFNRAYLSGYLSERYDVDEKESSSRVNERIKNSTDRIFEKSVSNYLNVRKTSGNVKVWNSKIKHVLLPVWILNTSHNDKNYTFVMNGQTGKFVGDLPVSKKRYWGLLAKLSCIYFFTIMFIIFTIAIIFG